MRNEMGLASSQPWTLFKYLYRDASNFKSRGSVVLSGLLSVAERGFIASKMEGGEFFIAEQIGVKPLYEALYELSDGVTIKITFGTVSEGSMTFAKSILT